MTLPDVYKYAAGLAWRVTGDTLSEAVTWFSNTLTAAGYQLPANTYIYVEKWGPRLGQEGTIEGHETHAGRPAQITSGHVAKAYDAALAWKNQGRDRPYASTDELADLCPGFRQVLKETNAAASTLIKRMQQLHPHFHRAKLKARHMLTAHEMAERVSICKQLVSLERQMLLRVVFLDMKTIWMWEHSAYGWIDTSVRAEFGATKPLRDQGQVIRLKYYGAVNAVLGPFFIQFMTGTTGITAHQGEAHYKVGSCAELLGSQGCSHVHDCCMQLLCPLSSKGLP